MVVVLRVAPIVAISKRKRHLGDASGQMADREICRGKHPRFWGQSNGNIRPPVEIYSVLAWVDNLDVNPQIARILR